MTENPTTRSRLAGMLQDRKDQTYDGECHLTNEEADEIIAALSAAGTNSRDAEPVGWTYEFELQSLRDTHNGDALMFRKDVAANIAVGTPIPLFTRPSGSEVALREALQQAVAQLERVHDDAFRQAAGYGLVTSDGRDFSCLELNRCSEVASKSRAALGMGE